MQTRYLRRELGIAQETTVHFTDHGTERYTPLPAGEGFVDAMANSHEKPGIEQFDGVAEGSNLGTQPIAPQPRLCVDQSSASTGRRHRNSGLGHGDGGDGNWPDRHGWQCR